jgi:CheY-like chemotaxis protein
VVLINGQISKIDSQTLVSVIRQQPHYQDVPLIVLTKNLLDTPTQTGMFPGMTYLKKPVKQSQFYDTLLRLFAAQQLTTQSEPEELSRTIAVKQFPLRILLAEDNAINQKLALLMLERLGYRADVAGNGLEVLEALYRQSYDIILMDIHMPEMDGLSATRVICQTWPVESRPQIVAMTANAVQGDRELYLESGMDDYISKPIRMEALRQALVNCKPLRDQSLAPASNSVLDSQVFQDLRAMMDASHPSELVELLADYLKDAPKLLQSMREATKHQDGEGIYQAAHALKSMSAYLGAITLSQLCETIEIAIRRDRVAIEMHLIHPVEAEYARVALALRQEIQRLSSH